MWVVWTIPVIVGILVLVGIGYSQDVFAETIYRSATLGPPDQTSGINLNFRSFFGSKFSTTQEFEVTAIETHMGPPPQFRLKCGGTFFGAILDMSGPFPKGKPFTADEVLATTLFEICANDSLHLTIPFSVILPPGCVPVLLGDDRDRGGNP